MATVHGLGAGRRNDWATPPEIFDALGCRFDLDVAAPWFQECWDRADAILFTPKTPFLLPSGKRAGNPAFGNALWACGERAVSAVLRAESRGFGKVVTREFARAA